MEIWKVLGIVPTKDKKQIKRAYATRSKEVHPEEKPEEFRMLHEAYKSALKYAEILETGQLAPGKRYSEADGRVRIL